jgi:hypothetical protein
MEYQHTGNQAIALVWKNAWRNKSFRTKTIIGSLILLLIMVCMPHFFGMMERRQGVVLHDMVLEHLPAIDVSVLTFIIIWSMNFLLIFRSVQNPSVFLLGLYTLILVNIIRFATITIAPLDPPLGLIPLKDPLSSLFYGGPTIFITKDLFFSGHTSSQFMVFLCLQNRKDKLVALISSIVVGFLVLIQHVHYTIDVAAAFVATYLAFFMARKMIDSGN